MSCRKKDDHSTGHRTRPCEVVKLNVPGPDVVSFWTRQQERGLPVKAHELEKLAERSAEGHHRYAFCVPEFGKGIGRRPSYSRSIQLFTACCVKRATLVPKSETDLVLFLTNLLAVALAGQCFLHPLLLARLQVKRVTFYFLNDVFRLHFTLEPAKSVLKRFTFLNTNLCQGKYTSKPSLIGFIS